MKDTLDQELSVGDFIITNPGNGYSNKLVLGVIQKINNEKIKVKIIDSSIYNTETSRYPEQVFAIKDEKLLCRLKLQI